MPRASSQRTRVWGVVSRHLGSIFLGTFGEETTRDYEVMKFEVQINVMPQRALLDPQGKAVLGTIHQMEYAGVQDVRMGKHIVLVVEAKSEGEASQIAGELSSRLLSNPVMESFEYSIQPLQ